VITAPEVIRPRLSRYLIQV